MKKVIKKSLISMLLLSILGTGASALDIQFKVLPNMEFPIGLPLDPSFSLTAAVDVCPITVRKNDSVYFSAQGSYTPLRANGIVPLNYFDFGLGAGYDFRLMDKLSLSGEVAAGFWFIPASSANGFEEGSGYSLSAKVYANAHVLPFLSIGAFAGYKYLGSNVPFMSQFEVGASIRMNLTKALSRNNEIGAVNAEISPLFPVFYSHYYDNEFGKVTYVNKLKNKITDVEVSIYIEEFMSTPSTIARFDSIQGGEEFTVNLTAFLNENILNTIKQHQTNAKVTVSYKNLGLSSSYTDDIKLVTLSRNNMSWEDDERAATFVSGKDASASRFARFVQLIMKNRINSSESENIQYARGIFAALKAYGINYVIDPSSAFTDNVGSANIDFLQFPYQTLLYHGGDCDDLTILNCSLLEALGIETALITVPGHIYMAFDSGYEPHQASFISDGNYIIQGDKVWIPVEITMCQDTFQSAKNMGRMEWMKAGSEAALIPVHEAWEHYSPISIPDSEVNFELPSESKVVSNLK